MPFVKSQNCEIVTELINSLKPLQVHRLHLCVTELLAAMLADSQVVSQSCVSSHPWASPGGRHICIQDKVRDVWEQQFEVSQKSAGHRSAGALLQELKSVESPPPTANVPFRQVQSPQSAFCISYSMFSDSCWLKKGLEKLEQR